jgi:ATP-binding protein involved in chromosome partitioning
MKHVFAVPTADGKICTHFGHCQSFSVVETEDGVITSEYAADPPEHQPGTYPAFLAHIGATVVIAGGMGYKAQELLRSSGIEVIVGAEDAAPQDLVRMYLSGSLSSGGNLCDH